MSSRGTPPPPPDAPRPPSFGWVTDPMGLTRNEIREFCAAVGAADLAAVDNTALPGLVAVAYARRADPVAYPWGAAGRIPLADLAPDDDQEDDQEDAAAAYAEERTAAALAGEEPPLPPP
ncbi:hypothetical protein ACIRQY_29110 [Streptomyces sp. NPDC101490]|uniref:hypothetical protein n=1 Tax=Streptomyces sp. NPDC101490 TaxID=3366143 RepID=UPI0037F5B635